MGRLFQQQEREMRGLTRKLGWVTLALLLLAVIASAATFILPEPPALMTPIAIVASCVAGVAASFYGVLWLIHNG